MTRSTVMVAVALTLALGACQLYFTGSSPPPPPSVDAGGPSGADAPSSQDDPACDAFVNCGPGRHCEPQCARPGTNGCIEPCHIACVADVGCSDVDCGPGKSCVESCLHDCSGFAWLCNQECVANGSAGSCTAETICARPPPACPPNTTPGVASGCYSGYCIPNAQCAAPDPGSCDASTVTCMAAPPSCPQGTVPGVDDTCWSGFCIPDVACPCDRLGTEDSCVARTDCAPIYRGGGCTCPTEICSCSDPASSFERCRAR